MLRLHGDLTYSGYNPSERVLLPRAEFHVIFQVEHWRISSPLIFLKLTLIQTEPSALPLEGRSRVQYIPTNTS